MVGYVAEIPKVPAVSHAAFRIPINIETSMLKLSISNIIWVVL